MVHLIAPNGALVSVDDGKAERLKGQGFTLPGDAAQPVGKSAQRSRRTGKAPVTEPPVKTE